MTNIYILTDLQVISATWDKSMATDVECEGNEKAKILQDSICKEEVSWM